MSPTAKHVDAEMRNLKFLENIFLSELFFAWSNETFLKISSESLTDNL